MWGYPSISDPRVPISALSCSKYPHLYQHHDSCLARSRNSAGAPGPLTGWDGHEGVTQVTPQVFQRWEGSMGSPIPALIEAAFKTSPTGQQPLKTIFWDFLHKEEGFDPSKGSSSCLVWMCSWSGGAGERWVWGPCLPHTTAHVLWHFITSPSCWLTLPPCFSTAKLPSLKANMGWADSPNC